MSQIGEHVEERIKQLYPDNEVRPQVLSPDQRQGDIAELPLFPNVALKVVGLEERVTTIEQNVSAILQKLADVNQSIGDLTTLARRRPTHSPEEAKAVQQLEASARDKSWLRETLPVDVQIQLREHNLAAASQKKTLAQLFIGSKFTAARCGVRINTMVWSIPAKFNIMLSRNGRN